MSKRLGNTVNPFDSIYKYGADANRWYMITNAQPWDNLKFDEEGLVEAQRKFFGTLFNTYSFLCCMLMWMDLIILKKKFRFLKDLN